MVTYVFRFGHGQGQDNHHLGVSRSLWNHYLSSNSKVAFTQTQTVTPSVMPSRVFLKTQNVSDRAPDGGHAVFICGGPPKRISEFYLNDWPDAQHICVLAFLGGKTPPKRA